jgi:hypothetical protein
VHIDFDKDNELPSLNKEDAQKIGIPENKKVLFKKSSIDRNEVAHSDLDRNEYNQMLGETLYNRDALIHNKAGNKNYWHFIKYQPRDNFITLLDCDDGKDCLEIVHLHKINVKKLARFIKKYKE